MSKQTARERMHQRRDDQRRQTQTILIVVVAVLALAVVGILIVLNQPKPPIIFIPGNYSGIAESVDETGAIGFVLGPADAPVTLTEYSDFSCPHCHDLEPTIQKLIDQYVKQGKLKIIYKPVTFVGGEYSDVGARGLVCAAAQGKAWEMHDKIWKLYETSNRNPKAYTQTAITGLAVDLSLDESKFSSCYDSPTTVDKVQGVQNEVQKVGVTATPTLFLDGAVLEFTGDDNLIIQAVDQKVKATEGAAPASPTP